MSTAGPVFDASNVTLGQLYKLARPGGTVVDKASPQLITDGCCRLTES